jgi:hypothetical protein
MGATVGAITGRTLGGLVADARTDELSMDPPSRLPDR